MGWRRKVRQRRRGPSTNAQINAEVKSATQAISAELEDLDLDLPEPEPVIGGPSVTPRPRQRRRTKKGRKR